MLLVEYNSLYLRHGKAVITASAHAPRIWVIQN